MARYPLAERVSLQLNLYNLTNNQFYDSAASLARRPRRRPHGAADLELQLLRGGVAGANSVPPRRRSGSPNAAPRCWRRNGSTAGHGRPSLRAGQAQSAIARPPSGRAPASAEIDPGGVRTRPRCSSPPPCPRRSCRRCSTATRAAETYGDHVDGAIWPIPGTPHRVRTDLSATLFLSAPDEYDGGELVVADTYGTQRVKLPAGDLILYPGTSLHRVEPVTRGARFASFFWIESMVRDDGQRAILFDLDTAIRELTAAAPRRAPRSTGCSPSTTIYCGAGPTHDARHHRPDPSVARLAALRPAGRHRPDRQHPRCSRSELQGTAVDRVAALGPRTGRRPTIVARPAPSPRPALSPTVLVMPETPGMPASVRLAPPRRDGPAFDAVRITVDPVTSAAVRRAAGGLAATNLLSALDAVARKPARAGKQSAGSASRCWRMGAQRARQLVAARCSEAAPPSA